MSDYTTLLGSEEVGRAGHAMQAAANDMLRAAGHIDESLRNFIEVWRNEIAPALERERNELLPRDR